MEIKTNGGTAIGFPASDLQNNTEKLIMLRAEQKNTNRILSHFFYLALCVTIFFMLLIISGLYFTLKYHLVTDLFKALNGVYL